MSTLFSLILLWIFPLYVFPYRLPSPLPPKERTLYDVLNLKNHKAKKLHFDSEEQRLALAAVALMVQAGGDVPVAEVS